MFSPRSGHCSTRLRPSAWFSQSPPLPTHSASVVPPSAKCFSSPLLARSWGASPPLRSGSASPFARSARGPSVFVFAPPLLGFFLFKGSLRRSFVAPLHRKKVLAVAALNPHSLLLGRFAPRFDPSLRFGSPLRAHRPRSFCLCAPRWSLGTAPLSCFLLFRFAPCKKSRQGLAAGGRSHPRSSFLLSLSCSPALAPRALARHAPSSSAPFHCAPLRGTALASCRHLGPLCPPSPLHSVSFVNFISG